MRAGSRVLLVVCIVVFCGLFVVAGTVLLATVQLRLSAGIGPNYDTWRRNYQANIDRRDGRNGHNGLLSQLEKARTHPRLDAKDIEELTFDKACLRLFDKNGNPNHLLIDAQTGAAVTKARQAHTPPEKLEGDVKCLVKGYTLLNADIKNLDSRAQQDRDDIDRVTSLLQANHQQYLDLTKGHQDFLAFVDMERMTVYQPFLLAPYDLLMLLLVMAMGASGGVLRLVRDYIGAEHPDPGKADYFFVPLIGAVVAMCGYVLAKTGLLALSSTREETSLSPFMISLVGIISGLLAREVIDVIAANGRKLLQGQGAEKVPAAAQHRAGQTAPEAAPSPAALAPATGP